MDFVHSGLLFSGTVTDVTLVNQTFSIEEIDQAIVWFCGTTLLSLDEFTTSHSDSIVNSSRVTYKLCNVLESYIASLMEVGLKLLAFAVSTSNQTGSCSCQH